MPGWFADGRKRRGAIIPGTRRHPNHDELVAEVGSWYARPAPGMGFEVKERRFGFYQRHKDTGRTRATVRRLTADEVPEFIEDLRRYSGGDGLRFYVDDRDLDARVAPALAAHGCIPEMAETFLAHTGGTPPRASASGDVSIEAADGDTIEEVVGTVMKGFADGEAGPDGAEFRERLVLRRAEMRGRGRFLLARVSGEPASALGFYEGEDRFVFNLATRVPFRGLGLASRLLLEVLKGARERGCRATVINADEAGRPAGLYRAAGFTDEVYWRRKYGRDPAAGPFR